MWRRLGLGLTGALVSGVLGCAADEVAEPAAPGDTSVTVGDVRFSLPTPHRVVVERRTPEGWGGARVVFEDDDRECGRVLAVAAGSTVAATVWCDEHFHHDQVPTASVALVSADAVAWTSRDLTGEAYAAPGVAPQGGHVVWVQDEDLVVWDEGTFRTAPHPSGDPQLVTVDDVGTIVGVRPRRSAGRCGVEIRTHTADVAQVVVPVARADRLQCGEVDLSFATPDEIHGDVSQVGSEFVVRRTSAGGWTLAERPPVAAPGLDVYPAGSAHAIWNQLSANTRGDLVAVGSPDRRHITAQRYDRSRQRWTRSRVVHDAGAPVCRRSNDDAGTLEGATFRLRLFCDGRLLVLRSRTGRVWST